MWNMLLKVKLLSWNVISSFLFSQSQATYPDVEYPVSADTKSPEGNRLGNWYLKNATMK